MVSRGLPATLFLFSQLCNYYLIRVANKFIHSYCIGPVSAECSIKMSLRQYRDANKESGSPLRIHLDRMEGELESDILALYKSKATCLRRPPKVRFEGEPAVGSGPVLEFFTLSMKLLEDGFSLNEGIVVLEGESDHKLPIANTMLRKTGMYETFGKMIGHSILHGGPGVFGRSPAVVHYWTVENIKKQSSNVFPRRCC